MNEKIKESIYSVNRLIQEQSLIKGKTYLSIHEPRSVDSVWRSRVYGMACIEFTDGSLTQVSVNDMIAIDGDRCFIPRPNINFVSRPSLNPELVKARFEINEHEEDQFLQILKNGIAHAEEHGGVSKGFLAKLTDWINGTY